MTVWLLICLLAVISFGNRYLFFARSFRFDLSHRTEVFLSYSSYAVLTAIWVPIVFSLDEAFMPAVTGVDYVMGVSVAAVLTLLRVPSIIVVLASMAIFWSIRFLL